MQKSVGKWVVPYIKKTQKWFKRAYGIKINRSQAASAAIHSIKHIPIELSKEITHYKTRIATDHITLSLRRSDVDKVSMFLGNHKSTFQVSVRNFIEGLIVFYSIALPELKSKKKYIQMGSREVQPSFIHQPGIGWAEEYAGELREELGD